MAERTLTSPPSSRREAILHGAASQLSRNPHASTAEIASACRVSRATLHRYFPGRESLVSALLERADQEILDAAVRADLTRGDHVQALGRLIDEFETRSPFTTLLYALSKDEGDGADSEAWTEADRLIIAFFDDGKRAHRFSPQFSATWMTEAFYALTAAGEWAVASGRSARQETPSLIRDLLLHGIGAGEEGGPR